MNRIQIQRAVERFIKEARRRDKRHRRSFGLGASLAGLMVPTAVVAGGGVPGFGTFVAWGLTAWGAYFLFRRLGRGSTGRMLDDLADRFIGLAPQGSAGYQVALTHLVKAKPRSDLLEALMQRIPGALDLDAATAGGSVTFGPLDEPAAASEAKPKGSAENKGPQPAAAPWPGSFPGLAKGGPSEQLLAMMKGSPFGPGGMMEQLLKAHPEAETIVSEQSDGKGGTIKTVKIFSSTTKTMTTTGPAPAAAKPKPPKAKPWKPEGALKPEPEPEPEPDQDGPAFIPLDPYEAEER